MDILEEYTRLPFEPHNRRFGRAGIRMRIESGLDGRKLAKLPLSNLQGHDGEPAYCTMLLDDWAMLVAEFGISTLFMNFGGDGRPRGVYVRSLHRRKNVNVGRIIGRTPPARRLLYRDRNMTNLVRDNLAVEGKKRRARQDGIGGGAA